MGDKMKEVIILSGKGGTGKTSLIGSFAHLADNKILVDCDVDASDLHLLLSPRPVEEHDFVSGVKARVETDRCSTCGMCAEVCQFDSVTMGDTATISELACEGCGVCAHFCPEQAIVLDKNHCGSWYISDTDYGPLVHAELFAGEENSGKLVSHIKNQAKQLAQSNNTDLILIDGSPGVGCPVIASLSNVDLAVVITEPTLSGKHDLERILDLTDHFKIPALVCINKWDIHPEMSTIIETACKKRKIELLGKIPFDPAVIECQIQGQPVTSSDTSLAAYSIRAVWETLQKKINQLDDRVSLDGSLSR
ncbi:MAG TPA: (4Fe-4S)-binding protein [Desulfocapsa sulfexigens]|nr:(4Fe-4S)-binding protein [Desulfocapsa sulfexigens]